MQTSLRGIHTVNSITTKVSQCLGFSATCLHIFKRCCVCFPADPPRVHEAVTRLSELCAEERRAASGRRCLVGRQGLLEAADQLHGRRREPRLLLPPPAAIGETTHTATQRCPLIASPIGWFLSVMKTILLNSTRINLK